VPESSRVGSFKQSLSYKPFGEVRHIRASSSGNVHDAKISRVNREFHVRGPNHEEITEILRVIQAYRLKK
jgi:hypothetical protein